jgi:hypothetical protein
MKKNAPSCGGTEEKKEASCSCGGPSKEIKRYKAVSGSRKIAVAGYSMTRVPVKPALMELFEDLLARFGIGRMDHAVEPGLYGSGCPDKNSPVLVSANYKMSFNALRKELGGIDAWILVIDTKGVNVWCAAGKGTFGTDELINRVQKTGLGTIIEHRELIVPQLGAPGIAAYWVKKATKFRVIYGPVEAKDIKGFLKAGKKATEEQRTVCFGAGKRMEVSLLEFAVTFRVSLVIAAAAVLAASFTGRGFSVAGGFSGAAIFLGALSVALISSTFAPALLLPYIPGKMFSVKGAVTGAVFSAVFVAAARSSITPLTAVSIVLMSTAFSSFVFMNYTGTTTFTSLTGVRREISVSIVPQSILLLAGAALQIIDFFHKGGIRWN